LKHFPGRNDLIISTLSCFNRLATSNARMPQDVPVVLRCGLGPYPGLESARGEENVTGTSTKPTLSPRIERPSALKTALAVLWIAAGLAMIAALLWLLNRVLPDSIPNSARLIMLVLFAAFLWVHIADARVGIDFLGRVRKR
jgi:hypothetical protein